MCGIIGYITKRTPFRLIEGLRKLEYRGGTLRVAVLFEGDNIRSYEGRLSVLKASSGGLPWAAWV